MKYTSFLIKYAEIAIKGKNRYMFEDALVRQIKIALNKCEGKYEISKASGRIYVEYLSDYDFDETVGALTKANVVDTDKTLYVAKFPSRKDDYNVGLWEHFSHLLATNAGVNTWQTII